MHTPTIDDSKSAIQVALDKAGISYAKSWNRAKLMEAWEQAFPPVESTEDLTMSFGPVCSQFLIDQGFRATRNTGYRTFFVLSQDQVTGLLEDLAAEVAKQMEDGSKDTARKLRLAHERIMAKAS